VVHQFADDVAVWLTAEAIPVETEPAEAIAAVA